LEELVRLVDSPNVCVWWSGEGWIFIYIHIISYVHKFCRMTVGHETCQKICNMQDETTRHITINIVKFTVSRINTVHQLIITIQYKLQAEIIYQVIYLY